MMRLTRRYSRPQIVRLFGLALSFVGTLIVGLVVYFKFDVGYGTPGWTSTSWRCAWLTGWFLLAAGFVLQFIGDAGPDVASHSIPGPSSATNPPAHYSDDELVAEHSRQGANSHFLSEMMRRLMRSNERLSMWLLGFTVAIFLLTLVLVWTAVRN